MTECNGVNRVMEFHQKFFHEISPTAKLPSQATIDFRVGFIKSELDELVAAWKKGDLVGVADGLGDINYVLNGFYLNTGLHTVKDALDAEIHRSNMSKMCLSEEQAKSDVDVLQKEFPNCVVKYKPLADAGTYAVYDALTSKILKPTTYFKPNLAPIVESAINSIPSDKQEVILVMGDDSVEYDMIYDAEADEFYKKDDETDVIGWHHVIKWHDAEAIREKLRLF